jgi:hypothetical protein
MFADRDFDGDPTRTTEITADPSSTTETTRRQAHRSAFSR